MDGQATEPPDMLPLSHSAANGAADNGQSQVNSLVDPTITSFLTLGDGDFSYSLDLAHFLASSLDSSSFTRMDVETNKPQRRYTLIATGIDSHDELVQKYTDGPFFIRQLMTMNNKQKTTQANDALSQPTTATPQLCIRIKHGINAIVIEHDASNEATESSKPSSTLTKFNSDHVIFNHPHLGREDAELHSRFLHHLLHSATKYWMKPNGGVFHLTLVEGQYERWKCNDAAKHNSLMVLEQNQFQPPPSPPPAGQQQRSYYQYRRHQTGKSFETRRSQGASWTYTFGRIGDHGMYVATCLPWQHHNTTKVAVDPTNDVDNNDKRQASQQQQPTLTTPSGGTLPCPYCTKRFNEERSRKCHIRDKHKIQATEEELGTTSSKRKKKKQRKNESQNSPEEIASQQPLKPDEVHYCEICAEQAANNVDEAGGETPQRRQFTSLQGLQDHVRAVHTARHKNILPDWAKNNQNTTAAANTTGNGSITAATDQQDIAGGFGNRVDFGSCAVCGLVFHDKIHSEQHRNEFVPPPTTGGEGGGGSDKFQCSFCSKTFREDRARKQHENFCPLQTEITN